MPSAKSLAKELGPKKIRVNSINPGMVETEGLHTAGFLGTDFHKQAIAQTPLGRIAQPEDIAKVAVFYVISMIPATGDWRSPIDFGWV